MKTLSLAAASGLSLALQGTPVLAHGAVEIHTHPKDMLGLAALVALVIVGGYIAWKTRT
ncbi:hypothetical protein [Pseudophaeobacter arcticus]|jgi:hypothetical protein|uniref:hypothetical protein n=1 Tax=Pseudophaeobacter arcticus TaxID=385492 RepID=UPI000418975F|nr:hypothetical protein [Pseudophaeobacter arcticus]